MNYKTLIILTLAAITALTMAAKCQSANRINISPHFSEIISHTSTNSYTDNVYHGEPTNGLGCNIDLTTFKPEPRQCVPWFLVYIYNESTNNFHFVKLPMEALFKIELLDLAGNPVERTIAGKKYENWWTDKDIYGWIHNEVAKGNSRWLFFSLWPSDSKQYGKFSIQELFMVKQAGEYALHFQMRLVRNIQDSSGVNQSTILLPDVVAKVQIQPEDIPPENLSATGKTNFLVK